MKNIIWSVNAPQEQPTHRVDTLRRNIKRLYRRITKYAIENKWDDVGSNRWNEGPVWHLGQSYNLRLDDLDTPHIFHKAIAKAARVSTNSLHQIHLGFFNYENLDKCCINGHRAQFRSEYYKLGMNLESWYSHNLVSLKELL